MNYFYTIKNGKPEHNLPERCIINEQDFKCKSWEHRSYLSQNYLIVTTEFFKEQIEPRLFWPTEQLVSSALYIGAFIIRTQEFGDVLAYCDTIDYDDAPKDSIAICPIERCITRYNYYKCLKSVFPKRNVKCFLTKDEWKADKAKKTEKIKKKHSEELNNWEDLRKTVQPFSMITPTFKVLDVVKKTESCSAQVGDTIYGEIPVITVDEHGPHGNLYGIGTCTNYVKVYVNGKTDKSLSPLIFQKLFLENYRVEIVKQ